MDTLFSVSTIAATPRPQTVGFNTLQKLCSDLDARYENLSEPGYGSLLVNTGIKDGDFTALTHSYIAFHVSGFPSYVLHTVTQQGNVSVSVQSNRDLGIKIGQVAFTTMDVGEVFYFRQPGTYSDRYGSEFEYSDENLRRDRFHAEYFCTEYIKNIYAGYSEEQASNSFPRNIRQGFVMSGSAMAIFQLIANYNRLYMSDEYHQMLELILGEMLRWMPEVANSAKC